MKRIVVLDYSFSAHLLGKIIEEEFPVEVERVLVGNGRDFIKKTQWEIREEIEKVLEPYIGEVELIIIADPLIAIITESYLQQAHPRQKFLSYSWDLPELLKGTEKALILVPQALSRKEEYQKMKAKCQETEILEADCDKWTQIIRGDEEVENTDLRDDINRVLFGKIIIYSSNLMLMEKRIKEKIGWRAEVSDLTGYMIQKIGRVLFPDIYSEDQPLVDGNY